MDEKEIKSSLSWNKHVGFRIVMEILSIAGPFLCVIFISWLVYYLVSGKEKKANHYFDQDFICERFFDVSKIEPFNYYPFLTVGFEWNSLEVKIPYYWIDFADKRYGGQTLTLQPSDSSMLGIHIQVIKDDMPVTNLAGYGRDFIEKIGFRNVNEFKMDILQTNACCFEVFYLAPAGLPMMSRFVFLEKNGYLIHIIMFAPKSIFKHRLSLFYAVINSLEYNTASD
ncbi:hypothetical protein J7L67_05500 [bacterium]|nr:hypothetical protein [bacterium]